MKNIVRTAKITVLVMAAALLASTGAANVNNVAVCLDAAEKAQWTLALPACTVAAKQGDAAAQFNLGFMYDGGWGVAQDYAQAVRWLTLAAEQGLAEAQLRLSFMYSDGHRVTKDYKKAIRWVRLAAEQGNVLAQNNLGWKYALGHGVASDYLRAHMWFNLAAVSGDVDKIRDRDMVARYMTREQIAEAQQMATDCKAKNYMGC